MMMIIMNIMIKIVPQVLSARQGTLEQILRARTSIFFRTNLVEALSKIAEICADCRFPL